LDLPGVISASFAKGKNERMGQLKSVVKIKMANLEFDTKAAVASMTQQIAVFCQTALVAGWKKQTRIVVAARQQRLIQIANFSAPNSMGISGSAPEVATESWRAGYEITPLEALFQHKPADNSERPSQRDALSKSACGDLTTTEESSSDDSARRNIHAPSKVVPRSVAFGNTTTSEDSSSDDGYRKKTSGVGRTNKQESSVDARHVHNDSKTHNATDPKLSKASCGFTHPSRAHERESPIIFDDWYSPVRKKPNIFDDQLFWPAASQNQGIFDVSSSDDSSSEEKKTQHSADGQYEDASTAHV